MSLIRLTIDRISYSQNTNGAYALLLSEKDGKRKLPVVIGGFEAQSIAVALEKEIKPPRPLTHDLFKNFSDCFEIKIKQVIIHKIIDGVFFSSLICVRDKIEEIIDSRTSDAIALAIRFNSPIFTYESVLEKAGIIIKAGGEKVKKESHTSKKVDFNKMSIKQIKSAIEIAVKNEDYELAAQLRDKLTEKMNSYLIGFFSNEILQNEIILSQGFSFESILRGIVGMIFLIFVAYLFSNNRKAINWKSALIGLSTQLILAILVLKVNFVQKIFEFFGKIFVKTLDFTMEGSKFLLGDMVNVETFGYVFLFQVLPTIIFFSALTSVLFYLGVIQKVVKILALSLSKLLNISGAESLSVAGNIFLGQTEAPLMIKAYLDKMTKSEILLVMIGGMATVAGGVLAAYIGFLGGEDEVLKLFYAKHLLTASVMAAPGAIVISKILFPETDTINKDVSVSQDKIGSNLLDAIANGTTEGLKLAANVGAMLLVFIAFIAMVNFGFEKMGAISGLNYWISENTTYQFLSIEFILGYTFSPVMWIIGVAKEDMALMGQLLGIKLAVSEFIGYMQLAELKDISNIVHLQYEKSIIMATYMLCGFANFASIGIQIGGIGSLAPNQRTNLSKFGMIAVLGGTLASLLSATIAGMIIG